MIRAKSVLMKLISYYVKNIMLTDLQNDGYVEATQFKNSDCEECNIYVCRQNQVACLNSFFNSITPSFVLIRALSRTYWENTDLDKSCADPTITPRRLANYRELNYVVWYTSGQLEWKSILIGELNYYNDTFRSSCRTRYILIMEAFFVIK